MGITPLLGRAAHRLGPFGPSRCPLQDLAACPSYRPRRTIRLCQNITECHLCVLQSLLEVTEMTQLALGKLTPPHCGLLLPEIRGEALPTACKVGVGHQGKPQIPIG